MISLPWGKVTHLVWSFCLECPKNFTLVTCSYIAPYLSAYHFFSPLSFFCQEAIHKLTHFLRLFIKLLLNHANWKHNETIWILGAENNLWHSTHFAVCTSPPGVCCQEDYLHLGFWHILQSAVSWRCSSSLKFPGWFLTVCFVEPEVWILKYWQGEDCKWVKVTYLSRGLCKCCFCPLLEELMHLWCLECFRCSALVIEPQVWHYGNISFHLLMGPSTTVTAVGFTYLHWFSYWVQLLLIQSCH